MTITLTDKKSAREARVGVRLRPEHKERIEKAALVVGQSVSDFITSTMLARADAVLEKHERITLGNAERDFFLTLLDADEEPNEALLHLAKQVGREKRERTNAR